MQFHALAHYDWNHDVRPGHDSASDGESQAEERQKAEGGRKAEGRISNAEEFAVSTAFYFFILH